MVAGRRKDRVHAVVGSQVRLFVANADGSGDTEILGLAGNIGNPAWSPDGSKIAFSLNNAGGPTQLDLYTVNPDGSGAAIVASGPLKEDLPSWSPDGTKIAFTRYSTLDNSTIWTMNADGTGQVQIAPCCASSPAWSPDGTKIVFRDNYFDPNLFVMDADGSNRTPLGVGGDFPDWQPDLWPGHARPKGATPAPGSYPRTTPAPHRTKPTGRRWHSLRAIRHCSSRRR